LVSEIAWVEGELKSFAQVGADESEESTSKSGPNGRGEAVVGEAEGKGSRRQQLDDGLFSWLGVWGV